MMESAHIRTATELQDAVARIKELEAEVERLDAQLSLEVRLRKRAMQADYRKLEAENKALRGPVMEAVNILREQLKGMQHRMVQAQRRHIERVIVDIEAALQGEGRE